MRSFGPDDELERLAFQDGIRTADPDQLIKEIKHLAVTTVHPALHVVSLHGSIQIQDEKIKTFCARIKGIAQNCNLKKTCSKSTCDEVVSFMEETCFHVAIAGLIDEDIKEKVSTEAMVGTVKDLSSLIEYVSAEESSKQKSPSRNISAIQKIPMKSPQDRKCIGCGMPQHGPFNRKRSKECKAYGKTCNKCQRQNYYTSLCKSLSVAGITENAAQEEEDPMVNGFITGIIHDLPTSPNSVAPQFTLTSRSQCQCPTYSPSCVRYSVETLDKKGTKTFTHGQFVSYARQTSL